MAPYRRPLVAELEKALARGLPFLHVITGPRQSGKTTAAEQASQGWAGEVVFAAADAPLPPGPEWIHAQWATALSRSAKGRPVLLVLDEVQKVRGWSETVKLLWDKERREKKGIRVVLLGSSSLLVQKGLSDRVRLLGYREDLLDILHLADLVVVPSLSESGPLVLLEAMAAAKPVIATDTGFVSEVLDGRSVGRLVAPGDPTALAQAIEELLAADEPALARMGAEAYRRALEWPTAEECGRRVLALYDEAVP